MIVLSSLIIFATLKKHRRAFTLPLKTAYHLYVGWQVGQEDKKWAHHSCDKNLRAWMKGTKSVPFTLSTICRDHKNKRILCK